jgi:hypothetical protein
MNFNSLKVAVIMLWSKIQWTQTEQILSLLDDYRLNRHCAANISPKDYFDGLVRSGALDIAVTFLGLALSSTRAVAWAYKIVAETRGSEDDYRAMLFARVGRWLDAPSDIGRREIWAAAIQHADNCPERLLAGAVYFSGGSIAPMDQTHLEPPPEVCGKLAGSAVIAAANRSDRRERILRFALLCGDIIASAED